MQFLRINEDYITKDCQQVCALWVMIKDGYCFVETHSFIRILYKVTDDQNSIYDQPQLRQFTQRKNLSSQGQLGEREKGGGKNIC